MSRRASTHAGRQAAAHVDLVGVRQAEVLGRALKHTVVGMDKGTIPENKQGAGTVARKLGN